MLGDAFECRICATQVAEHTFIALGLAGLAHVAAMQYEPMVGGGNVFFGYVFYEGFLGSERIL